MQDTKPARTCPLCHGTNVLDQKGIARIYLLARPVPLLFILLGIVMSFLWGPLCLLVSLVGYLLPLISADLRLSLYPIVALGALTGKKVNCPKCNPGGGVFKEYG